jgi:hypothetical protein
MTVFGLTATSHLVPPLSGRVAGCPALGHGLIWAHAGRDGDRDQVRLSLGGEEALEPLHALRGQDALDHLDAVIEAYRSLGLKGVIRLKRRAARKGYEGVCMTPCFSAEPGAELAHDDLQVGPRNSKTALRH